VPASTRFIIASLHHPFPLSSGTTQLRANPSPSRLHSHLSSPFFPTSFPFLDLWTTTISTSRNAMALVCPSFSVLSTVSWLLTIFLIFFSHLDPFFSCVRLSVKAHIQSFQPSFLLVQVSCRDSLYLSSPRSSRKDWYLITSEFSVLSFLSFVCNPIFLLFAWDLQFAELLSANTSVYNTPLTFSQFLLVLPLSLWTTFPY
jgi:hypothetical protein